MLCQLGVSAHPKTISFCPPSDTAEQMCLSSFTVSSLHCWPACPTPKIYVSHTARDAVSQLECGREIRYSEFNVKPVCTRALAKRKIGSKLCLVVGRVFCSGHVFFGTYTPTPSHGVDQSFISLFLRYKFAYASRSSGKQCHAAVRKNG